MNVVRTDRGINEFNLTITIEPEQYQPAFQNELRKFQQKAQIKGFRKGKMPLPVVRKMYGLAILNDVVTDLTQKAVQDYITTENLKVFDKPVVSDEHEPINMSLDSAEPYVFRFIIGLVPQFELEGLDKSFTFKRKKILISDERVGEVVKNLQRRHGKEEVVEEGFEDLDTIKIDIVELDGDQIKEDGHQASFTFMPQNVDDPMLVQEIKSKRIGDTFRFDVFKFEKNTTESFARKYFLKLPEEQLDKSVGSMFEATILSASRIVPASLDSEFFEAVFSGANITDEDAFREKIREEESLAYENATNDLLYADLRRHLFDSNPLELPQTIMVRQIIENQNVTDHDAIQKIFNQYAGHMTWSLIEKKIKEQFDFQLTEQEIFRYLGQRVLRYFGTSNIDPETYRKLIGQLAQDEEAVRNAVSTVTLQKVLAYAASQVTVEDEIVTEEAFKEELDKLDAHQHDHDHDHDHEHDHDHDHDHASEHHDHSHDHVLSLDVSNQEDKPGEESRD